MWLALALLGLAAYLLSWYLGRSKDFWAKYNVPQIDHTTLVDNIKVLLGQKIVSDQDQDAYQMLGSGKFCGLYQMGQPILLAKDLEIVKKIMIKDFDHFTERRPFTGSPNQEIVNKLLFNLAGEEWKGVRTSLSPTFTTGKIRRMMSLMNNTAYEWVKHFNEGIEKSPQKKLEFTVLQETTNFTVDTIATSVFGINAGTIHNPDAVFAQMVKKATDFNFIVIAKFFISQNFPSLVKLFNIDIFEPESLAFFVSILSQGIKERMDGKVKRNDFLQLLIEARKGELKAEGSDELGAFEKDAELRNHSTEKKNYLHDDLTTVAQALQFFFAGFSTTSNFLAFAFYFLAKHPEVQDKLREEVNSQLFPKGDEKEIDYDKLNGLTYLDMFVQETLRKFPALARLERMCGREYFDKEENLKIPKGAMVCIPVQAIHNDKQHYEYPDKFYPEHFTAENKAKRSPYAYLPFGQGPRNCIGMRFALIEGKAALAHLVHAFKLEPSLNSPMPVKMRSAGFGEQLPDDFKLSVRPAK